MDRKLIGNNFDKWVKQQERESDVDLFIYLLQTVSE